MDKSEVISNIMLKTIDISETKDKSNILHQSLIITIFDYEP